MSIFQFTNNASTTLATAMLSTDTQLTVATGTGAKFPALSAGQIFAATIEDTSGNIEIVYCTGIVGDTFSISRGEENTTALGFASGSRVELRLTAGILAALLQKNGGDVLSGTTTFNGVINAGSSGSFQGGEIAGTAVRGAPGATGNQVLVPTDGVSAPYIGTSTANIILTQSNVAANLPSGVDFARNNMIVFWNGASNAVPAGWHICDGTNGTPDLRDHFILGGGGALATTGGTANTVTGATDPSGQITITGTSLTVAQLPSHSHDFYMSATPAYGGSPNAPYTVPMISSSGSPGYQTNVPSGFSSGAGSPIIQAAGSGSTHTHGITGNLSHVHAYSLPPYVALLAIMKL